MAELNPQQQRSIHDIALIVIDECSKVFFDRTKPLDQRPEVVAIFGAAISEIVSPLYIQAPNLFIFDFSSPFSSVH